MDANQKTAVHIIVHGYVQGVGFRYFTQKRALSLGIVGWVRNQHDGTVEVWAEGKRPALNNLINAVRRGPSHSTVEKLDITWGEPTNQHTHFRTRYV